jgi:hypothetical protein
MVTLIADQFIEVLKQTMVDRDPETHGFRHCFISCCLPDPDISRVGPPADPARLARPRSILKKTAARPKLARLQTPESVTAIEQLARSRTRPDSGYCPENRPLNGFAYGISRIIT